MTMSKLLFCIVLSISSIFVGILISDKILSDKWHIKEKAFNECISELSNKCSSTIEYAIMLENENARLNKIKKNCNK